MRFTETESQHYQEHGYVVRENAYPTNQIDALAGRVDWLVGFQSLFYAKGLLNFND
jgi:hypothetical protein